MRFLAVRLVAALGVALCANLAAAGANAPAMTDSPPNEPRAILDAILARDYSGYPRYTGGHETYEYRPIFESYPPYDLITITEPDSAKPEQAERAPTFGKCAQTMVIKNIRTTKVEAAPDMTSPPGQMRGLPWEAIVTVEAEVVALVINTADSIPTDRRCSWLGLEVKNTKTGKTEHYFDNVDNGDALLAMMKQFGAVHEVQYSWPKHKSLYVLVEPHRRQWSWGVSMILPPRGRAGKRHYDQELRDYVAATEPRWLLQDPYPPQAIHLPKFLAVRRNAIKQERYLASQSCKFAIAEAKGVGVEKILQADFEHPACLPGGNSPRIQDYFRNIEAIEGATRFLSQIR